MLQRIKDSALQTLRLTSSSDGAWEAGLTRALNANAYEHINFLRAKQGCRVLFMPHSPGIYIALVLKNAEEIYYDNSTNEVLGDKSLNNAVNNGNSLIMS
jgi:hypothetical protein